MDECAVPEPLYLPDIKVGVEIQVRDVHGHVIYDGEVVGLTTGDDPLVTFRDVDGQMRTKGAAEMGLLPYPDHHWCGQRKTYPRSNVQPEQFPRPEDCIPTLTSVS